MKIYELTSSEKHHKESLAYIDIYLTILTSNNNKFSLDQINKNIDLLDNVRR